LTTIHILALLLDKFLISPTLITDKRRNNKNAAQETPAKKYLKELRYKSTLRGTVPVASQESPQNT